MESKMKLPKSFFEKSRPVAPKNSLKDITPINWSKEVLCGKIQVLVKLPKNK